MTTYSKVFNQDFGEAKFAVGIDLGTTHCALTYSELELVKGEKPQIKDFTISQVVALGKVQELPLLPSYLYLPHSSEMTMNDIELPWNQDELIVVGDYAREKGASTPNRIVSSAKSWLCQENIDKRAGVLPQNPAEDIEAFSPLQASIYYLEHLRNAWDTKFPKDPLYKQNITLTIPASFDPAARELTAEAARLSDMENLTLLEEPQAAFYNWLHKLGKDWREYLNVGDVVLVIDIGGGTTDLSLISVEDNQGDIAIRRVAVGDHLLVGGDNMDLMLAHIIAMRLQKAGKKLESWQVQALTHSSRVAKEKLLSNDDLKDVSVVIPGRSSRLIGKSIKSKMTKEDVQQAILNSFFPEVPITSAPISGQRSGIARIGLNYVQDAAITRHLAAFLTKQKQALGNKVDIDIDFAVPTTILFNGGVFKSASLRDRLLNIINVWLKEVGKNPVKELPMADYDQGVAKGAAIYGHVQVGNTLRIKGGSAQSFYIGIELPMPAIPGFEAPIEALCIAPFGMEEGSILQMPEHEFGLVIGEPVSFRFFYSNSRRDDAIGAVLTSWDDSEIIELQSLNITLKPGKRKVGEVVPIYLIAENSDIGTLILKAHAKDSDEVWNIEFNIREVQS